MWRLQLTLPTSFSFLLTFKMNKFKYIPRSSYTLQNLPLLCFGFHLPCCSLYCSSANEINCFSRFVQYIIFRKPERSRREKDKARNGQEDRVPPGTRFLHRKPTFCFPPLLFSHPGAWVV